MQAAANFGFIRMDPPGRLEDVAFLQQQHQSFLRARGVDDDKDEDEQIKE